MNAVRLTDRGVIVFALLTLIPVAVVAAGMDALGWVSWQW